jgi:nitrate reductase NapE
LAEARRAVPRDVAPVSRREEVLGFVVLAVVIWPIIAIGVVGGFGFLIWMWQIVFGPPGPPG